MRKLQSWFVGSTMRMAPALLLVSAFAIGATPPPASTLPATSPADGPTAIVQTYFSLINHQDRKAALALWDTSSPNAAQTAALHVDMMLALARLKQAAATRWGSIALYDLRMAVINPDECGTFTETIKGDTATVTVASNDAETNVTRPADPYSMIRSNGKWLLSYGTTADRKMTNEQMQKQLAGAEHLISLIDQAGKDVQAGRCADTNDVLKHISEGMGSP